MAAFGTRRGQAALGWRRSHLSPEPDGAFGGAAQFGGAASLFRGAAQFLTKDVRNIWV